VERFKKHAINRNSKTQLFCCVKFGFCVLVYFSTVAGKVLGTPTHSHSPFL